jgi:hypothetical protein
LTLVLKAPQSPLSDVKTRINTFFTGLRGIVAPLVAFHLVNRYSMETLGYVNAGLIVLASLVLVREIKAGRSPDPGTTLVEKAAG